MDMETSINLRTSAQNRRLYWLKGQLAIDDETLAEMVWNASNGRTHHSSELSYMECQQLISSMNSKLRNAKVRDAKEGDEEMDRLRKRVLRAIFRYGELQGLSYSMEYVKGIACRAACVDDFNRISKSSLRRIYCEFCKKQGVLEAKASVSFVNVSLN